MAEDGGVEPHPISENPVFKAGRRTNPAASSSIFFLAGTLGIEPKLTESKSAVLPLHNVPTIKHKFLKNNKKPLDFLGLGVCGILDF